MSNEIKYALAVRDDKLYLVLWIRRNQKGEIFYLLPRDNREGWDAHGSYHRDGRYHHKSFKKKIFPDKQARGPKPDGQFAGTINLVTTGISSEEPRAINIICNEPDFSEILELPVSDISPKNRTLIAIDLTEPGGQPVITPGAQVIRSWSLNDAIPWILVTIFKSDL